METLAGLHTWTDYRQHSDRARTGRGYQGDQERIPVEEAGERERQRQRARQGEDPGGGGEGGEELRESMQEVSCSGRLWSGWAFGAGKAGKGASLQDLRTVLAQV